jgi:hypothetical protein
MKRFLLGSAAFILFCSVTYVAATIVIGSLNLSSVNNLKFRLGGPGHLFTKIQELDSTRNVDILFLGSSHAYRGYDTRKFSKLGFRAFNLGSSAQTPLQTEMLVNTYLKQLNPKLVVVDIHPGLFSSDGIESTLDLLNNGKLNFDLMSLALKSRNIKVYNTMLVAGFRQAFDLNRDFKEPIRRGHDTYVPGGYVETYQTFKPKGRNKAGSVTYKVSDHQLNALTNIIDILKQNHIPYILVRNPAVSAYYKSIKNNAATDSLFAKFGDYYNFNNIITLPDSAFYDNSHLNQIGVDIFNDRLIDLLISKKILVKDSQTSQL